MRFLAILVGLVLGHQDAVAADEAKPVTSIRKMMLEKGNIIVPAGFPMNHEPYQAALDKLWAQEPEATLTDSYKQPWKTVTLSALESILGPIPRSYVVAHASFAQRPPYCAEPSGLCAPRVDTFRIHSVEVKRAALFKWGCDDSTIPVLDLGRWPWEQTPEEWPTAVAISLSVHDTPEISKLDPTRLPKELAERGATGSIFVLPKTGQRFAITYFLEWETNIFDIVQKSAQGKDETMRANGPFDGRC